MNIGEYSVKNPVVSWLLVIVFLHVVPGLIDLKTFQLGKKADRYSLVLILVSFHSYERRNTQG